MSNFILSPSAEFTTLLASLRQAISGGDDQATALLDKVEAGLKTELGAVADTYFAKVPTFGPVVDQIVKAAIDTALDDGLAQLTAAKTALAS